jgi:outer membrane protein assembly factor BamB
MRRLSRFARFLMLIILTRGLSSPSRATELEQIISRENPAFQPLSARLTVGRDSFVYLCSGGNTSFVLRLRPDGSDKVGGNVVYAAGNATANRDGVLATANAHFAHKITLYGRGFDEQAAVADFLVSDAVGWDAPPHVEAGASGDFYGADPHRDRILRVSPDGKLIKAIGIPHSPTGPGGDIEDFRVSEQLEAFYLFTRSGPLRCVGFDGKERWTFQANIGWGDGVTAGGFDVDDNGILYAIEERGDAVQRVAQDGKPLAPLRLQLGENKPKPVERGFLGLRVVGAEILLRRQHPTELFQRYDLATGERKGAVHSDHERLTVRYPGDVWTAGEAVPFRIECKAGTKAVAPRWRVWARPLGGNEYREFLVRDGQLQVPADAAGFYQIKVTPEISPPTGAAADYQVRGWVEVRQPNTHGSITVLTPANRMYFGQGEEVPFKVVARGKGADEPVPVTVHLVSRTETLAEEKATTKDGQAAFVLAKTLTAGLRPGPYRLTATAPGLTTMPQDLVIGPGIRPAPFSLIQYGDYGPTYPSADLWDAPDRTTAHVERTAKLGFNLMVDRLGVQRGAFTWDNRSHAELDQIRKRLQADPLAVTAEKAQAAPPLLQALAGYSAIGVEQMAILMNNDAGLPLGGPGFDNRKPDQLTKDLTEVTRSLMGSPSFRGWSWASNWWIYEQRGANAARTPEEKAAYLEAVKQARATGAWNPVLDVVSDRRLGYAVEAQELFNKTLAGIAPKLVTASACPHRNVESYPPVSLSNVQEVDLQAQWEQILLPYSVPHGVDFYKRPGKRAWTHPEVWNDAGTGEQILPTLFQGVMRGADGVGFSGSLPPWGAIPEDPRLSYDGTASVYRALTGTLRPYGPWLTSLQSGNDVAIVVSGRMLRLDEWGRVCGVHFSRLFEAYATCLHAHHPGSYVFVEDLKPDTLTRYKAILIVGQTVEMEPVLVEAIKKAQAAKVRVYHDGTCRPELVKEFEPLGLSFNQFEKDPRPAEDDHAYWRFPAYCVGPGRALAKILDGVTPHPGAVDDAEVFVSERRAEQGRYLFVVNNAGVKIEPGLLWRTTLGVASRRPQTVPVRLRGDGGVVYDVFALKEVQRKDGRVVADCRSLPARIFAMLPAPIDHMKLQGPDRVGAGRPFSWSVAVQDAKETPIAASIPVRVRLLAADGTVLDEHFVAAGSRGASGVTTACVNVAGDQIVEATELFSGKTVRLPIKIMPAERINLGAPADEAPPPPNPPPPVGGGQGGGASGKEIGGSFTPAEQRFGPHIKDVVVSGDGSLAVLNAMNWDDNLLAVDVKTGEVRWRQRLGHYFAFAPQGLAQGFAAQGFDFASAEGYHLYLGGMDGEPRRRFALYGLPQRLPHRFVPALVNDRINNFAVPADGSWVASAGDLGLAVWDRDGKRLWSQDWWKAERHTASLLALDAKTLVTIEGMKASAYEAETGKRIWEISLAATGEVRQVVAGADGKSCYVLATSDGGRIMVIRDGRLTQTLPAEGGRAVTVAPDGSRIAFVAGNQLKLCSLADGLQWILPADDTLHAPRFSPDGKRIVACSDLGSVYVAGSDGRLLCQRDLGALAVPAWLPDGDLLLATWMGTMVRLDGQYGERWRVRLEAPSPGRPVDAPIPDRTPTARIASWGNAEAQPSPLTPNLLDTKNVVIRYQWPGHNHVQLQGNPTQLVDGKAEAPKQAWLPWDELGHLAEGSNVTWLLIDTYRTQLRVTGITLAEDADHPESWLRDVRLEYWDAAAEQWRLVQPLLSNAAVHTHRFAKPVEAARFRIVLPKLMYGNLRLAQIVLHGEALGPSHPDVIAKRPVAVLFDEGDDLTEHLTEGTFRFEGAFAGGRCLMVPANGNGYPPYRPPMGHVIPNWDFEIAENPGPGQYRYAQFAWKALSSQTKGILLRLDGDSHGKSLGCYAGEFTPEDGMTARKIADAPPQEWQVVRVDLWEVFKTPFRIRGLRLATRGGAAVFDQILLGQSEKDLPSKK